MTLHSIAPSIHFVNSFLDDIYNFSMTFLTMGFESLFYEIIMISNTRCCYQYRQITKRIIDYDHVLRYNLM